MGARGIGHIAELCAMARPTIGVVTTVEMVHTELFGDLGAVAGGQGRADRGAARRAARRCSTPTTRWWRPWPSGPRRTCCATAWVDAEVRAAGHRDRRRAAAVVPAAHPVGRRRRALVGPRDRTTWRTRWRRPRWRWWSASTSRRWPPGSAEATMSPWRMDLRRTASGAVVLNDAYNAGPASMEAALRALAHLDARRRIAVLGRMAELGAHGGRARAHRRAGRRARRADHRRRRARLRRTGGAGHRGGTPALGALGADDAVLVKGSRVAGLEQLAQALLGFLSLGRDRGGRRRRSTPPRPRHRTARPR